MIELTNIHGQVYCVAQALCLYLFLCVYDFTEIQKCINNGIATGVKQQPVNEAARKEILAAWQEDS